MNCLFRNFPFNIFEARLTRVTDTVESETNRGGPLVTETAKSVDQGG